MSFLSVGPQSRVVLESHSDSLLAQFDTHLQIIADRYLAFFQERSVDVIRVFCITLPIQFSGEELRYPSQFCFEKLNPPSIWADSGFIYLEVSILYGNFIIGQQSLMPHLTHVPNQLRREQHGIQ